MGEQEELPEWLPAGWTMEVRLRKDGRPYKCYTEPTSDLKFYSKPEVLRHLKNVGGSHSTSKETKKKSTSKRATNPVKYVIKKGVAEGLPPGWIKEMRIRKKSGREQRADKYYIDPVSGRVFRSMKEVSRYLETGEFGRSASKSKDKGHADVEPSNCTSPLQAEGEKKRMPKSKASKEVSKDQDMKSGAEAEEVKVTESEANKEVSKDQDMKSGAEGEEVKVTESTNKDVSKDQDKKSSAEGEELKVTESRANKEVRKYQDMKSGAEGEEVKVNESKANKEVDKYWDMKSGADGEGDKVPDGKGAGGERERIHLSKVNNEVVKDQDLQSGSRGTRKRNKTLPVDKQLEKRKKESDFSGSTTVSASLKTDITEKLLPVNEAKKHGNRKVHKKNGKLKDESEAAMPRRTSKRLAGVELDQLVELETNSRARQVAGEQLCGREVDTSKNSKDLISSDKQIRRVQPGSASDGKRQGPVLLPAGYLPLSQDHVGGVGSGCKHVENVAEALDSSCKDFLNDPCIEFAIKTLTDAIPVGDDKADNPGCSSSNANPASALALPCGDLWTDPWFEFAVKTLTGEIPLEDDSCIKTLFHQPLSSSEAQRHSGSHDGSILATVKSDSFLPVNHSFTRFGTAENPLCRQQDLVTPAESRVPNGR